MFDVFVDKDGKTTIGLLDGEVDVCPPVAQTLKCERIKKPGRFIRVEHGKRPRFIDRPAVALMGGIAFARAFPFLSGRIRLGGRFALAGPLRGRIFKRIGLRDLRRVIPGFRGLKVFNPRGLRPGKRLFKGKKRLRRKKKRRRRMKLFR